MILRLIASVGEPARRIFGRDGRQRSLYGLHQCLVSTYADLTHELLYLAEGFLYGVQIRRVAGKESQLAATLLNESTALVRGEVVHKQDLPAPEA